ncbi:hypothetical protein Cgig2_032904 [Carnegiea gigantea]|uniref:Uncharacterized protein n=1 Tax=Carnegiea gigantea TaxID=171969 RepID=A0A9Q1JX10_9CARY|nr:hypothetical protein Cgig2_032904 [Carnegiea gigantea]
MEYDKGKAKAYESTLNECSTKIVVTIARGYAEGISCTVWKARIRGTQQVMNIEQGAPVNIPIITFNESKRRPVMALFDDLVVIELKVASALVCIILIDTRNSADIITWECLQKLKYPGRDITPLDQCTTHECYLVSIKRFVGQGCSEEPAVLKKPSRVLTLGLVNNGSSLLMPLRFGQFLIPLVLLEFLWLIIFRILIHRLFVIKDDLIRTLAGSWHSLLVLNIPHSGFKIPTPSFEV